MSPPDDDRAWRGWYGLARWDRIRVAQLTAQPLCERCLTQEIVELATVVHHVDAHRGDPVKFWGGPFQSLCPPCHNKFGQLEDHGKKTISFDAAGWPI